MISLATKIVRPELVFGFVAPIGSRIDPVLIAFKSWLEAHRYRAVDVKVTRVFKGMAEYIPPEKELKNTPLYDRYTTHIEYGNQLREHFGDDSVLASLAISQIVRKRLRIKREHVGDDLGTAYIVHQFKRKEEIELFRSVYGPCFFQVSVYSRRGARVDTLARTFAASQNSARPEQYRSLAEGIIQRDEDEVEELHGQRVAKIFHDADFIVSLDNPSLDVQSQVSRFCEALFSSNCVSPTRSEYGMYTAKAASMQTLDLSRQVGAAIFNPDGDILSLEADRKRVE